MSKRKTLLLHPNEPATHTVVKLSITDGTTTFVSKQGQPISDEPETFNFTIAASEMVLVDGAGNFQDVVSQAACVGFQFQSTEGQYLETLIFDDLSFTEETASANAE